MLDFIGEFTILDLVVIVSLAGGVLIGFQQGALRYILNSIVVLVAFIVASQLKGPIADAVNGVWHASSAEQQELWIFIVLFAAGVIGGFIVVRTFYRQTRLPVWRQVDEILGAALGVLWVALLYSFSLIVLDSFFLPATEASAASASFLGPLYDAMNQSVILGWFRDSIIPVLGFIVRPFVPAEIAQFLGTWPD